MRLAFLPNFYLPFLQSGFEMSVALCAESVASFCWNCVDFSCCCSSSVTVFMRAYDIICIHDVGLIAAIRRCVTFLWRAIHFLPRRTAHLLQPSHAAVSAFPMSCYCQMRCLWCGKCADKLNWRACRMSNLSIIAPTNTTTPTHTCRTHFSS